MRCIGADAAGSSASPAWPGPAAASSSCAPDMPWAGEAEWKDAQAITLTDPATTIDAITRAAARALTT